MPDPVTGEIVWLHADGTFQVSAPEGFITDYLRPVNPRWKTTLAKRRQKRKDRAEFYNRCHSAVEKYENDLDYDACMATIRTMEDRFGMTFEYPPSKQPEDTPDILAALERDWKEIEYEEMQEYYSVRDFSDPEVASYV